MNKITFMVSICLILILSSANAQSSDRWQQAVKYEMDIDMDVSKHQFTGKQKIVYSNNSPDDLKRVFYHLYFNAFQPNSMMDVRSNTIADADPRVGSRISSLNENEIGYHKIKSLKHNGKSVKFEVVGTILEVELNKPIKAGKKATLEMEFESQVPVQIRRSGRDNKEGIDYSMSQWYPRLCEYDYQGWHANPYVGREFHGIWGDFDVKINIDKDYVVAAGGYLQNPNEVGYGYEEEGSVVKRPSGDKLKWHFKTPNVIDFCWAADRDYKHTRHMTEAGVMIHCFYQENENTETTWKMLPGIMDKALTFINKNYGEYPYKSYAFIQGGDGGMEYPLATLITGNRSLGSLVGVSVHEWMHSWYQMMLGTNESLYAWMDEGFTSYTSNEVMNHLASIGAIPGATPRENPHAGSYTGYTNFVKSGRAEPLTTHADHFNTNSAYSVASYVTGAVFLHQLEYIVGEETFDRGMLTYFDTWKFRHPNPNDFIRIMEKESGLELDWYREYWIGTTHMIDYSIAGYGDENGNVTFEYDEEGNVSMTALGKPLTIEDGKKKKKKWFNRKKKKKEKDEKFFTVDLKREGIIPMPVDLVVTMKDGSKHLYYIPLQIMRGEKPQETMDMTFTVLEDWPWTHPTYEATINLNLSDVKRIEIDPSERMADVNRFNNGFENPKLKE